MVTTNGRHIVIIGGGIIGCTTAYYLSRHPSYTSDSNTDTITLLEASQHGTAQGASGKAGGLVAKWAYPKELVDLSFNEHVGLAKEHNGKERWGWRYVNCGSWEGRGEALNQQRLTDPSGTDASERGLEKTLGLPGGSKPHGSTSRKAKGLPDDLQWVKENLTDGYLPMAKAGDTAQVHPYLFTTSMFELAEKHGVKFIAAKAISIIQADDKVVGVEYEDNATRQSTTIPATHVIVAAGAWSPTLVQGLPISATRAHSITIRPQPNVRIAPYVLFTEIAFPMRLGGGASPEIYARPDNEIYVCGSGDDSSLPNCVDDVVVDQTACDALLNHASSISDEIRHGTVEKKQACFLPVVSTGGGPFIGEVGHIAKGLYLATGHTCWVSRTLCGYIHCQLITKKSQGICNAPGTAKALAELIMDGRIKSANLKKLHPFPDT